jgi:uncharacterized heparinase superfamily protein
MKKFLTKLILILNTVKYLKLTQIFYQIFYRFKKKSFIKSSTTIFAVRNIKVDYFIAQKVKYCGNNSFSFLNLTKDFNDNINWNFSEYGKLWNYNLEYFDFLKQNDIDHNEKIKLIHDFYSFSIQNKRILEPYPVSLRVINIIKFISSNGIKDNSILNSLAQELVFLSKNLEFHILGNHLLENLFALLLGGYYFDNSSWIIKAQRNLKIQLDEQILQDGAHFELSPMYHQIILFRLLELIEWYSKQENIDKTLLEFFKEKSVIMLGWLKSISFQNGDIPLFKDSAKDITYSSVDLYNYAKFLDLVVVKKLLIHSGYRAHSSKAYEIKMNFAQVGASYQPGHAHADALSFILYYNNKPFFVEQGTSTYQIGDRRNLERSTEAHNTVTVNNTSQSEVWGGFRVGRRAKCFIIEENENKFVGYHDGYKRFGTTHQRSFELLEDKIFIDDSLTNSMSGVVYFHIAPKLSLQQIDNTSFVVDDKCILNFSQVDDVKIENYLYADSYNKYQESLRLKVRFTSKLKTSINFL